MRRRRATGRPRIETARLDVREVLGPCWHRTIPDTGLLLPWPERPLRAFAFERDESRERDVQVRVLFCGACHSDILEQGEVRIRCVIDTSARERPCR